jgi:hypothetical protein
MYLAHLPLNHHLRPLYRLLAGLSGLYLVGFGVVGFVESAGLDFFARVGLPTVLGQRVNPAQAGIDVVVGAIVVIACVLGRNIDHYVNFWVGHFLLVVGLAFLAVLRTDANVLGYDMTNVIVTFTVALLVLAGSLYGKVGPVRPSAPGRDESHQPVAARH